MTELILPAAEHLPAAGAVFDAGEDTTLVFLRS
jgi:hypothetical protein